MKRMISKHDLKNRNQQRTLLVNNTDGSAGLSIRFSQGESWDEQSAQLAMLVSQQQMLNEINICQRSADDHCYIDQVIIKRNHHQPLFEPSRHEMRVFDDLDGLVPEM